MPQRDWRAGWPIAATGVRVLRASAVIGRGARMTRVRLPSRMRWRSAVGAIVAFALLVELAAADGWRAAAVAGVATAAVVATRLRFAAHGAVVLLATVAVLPAGGPASERIRGAARANETLTRRHQAAQPSSRAALGVSEGVRGARSRRDSQPPIGTAP